MALLGLQDNFIVTKIILTTDGTIGYAKSDIWCQMVWHPILVENLILTSAVWCRQEQCSPYTLFSRSRCGRYELSIMGNWVGEGVI